MAYNLESLITVLQQILNPEQKVWIVDRNKPQLQSLLQKATSLKQVFEKYSGPRLASLESQITDAAYQAEDAIESHMADQILSNPERAKYNFSTPNLEQVVQELDSAMEQVMKLLGGKKILTGSTSGGASFSPDLSSKSIVVGLDEDLMKLRDRLTGSQSKIQIIPIVGMGGIGKTTLARKLYNDPLIVSHFTTCGWITISQDYNVRAILLGLLYCITGKQSDELTEKKDHELKHTLYQELYVRRYLIVLDDMWGTKSWDDVRRCFPDANNGSRILLTTRESDVANHVDSQSLQHQVQLLSKFEGWNLLHQNVFGDKDCPVLLQEVGRKIASDCGGLPLAIHVIGGLLSKADKSKDVWENISNDVRAAIAETDEKFSNILSLSYNHLPNHLKPCFQYMAAFPEDHQVRASKLIHLWVSEGFLKSNGDRSLEEDAENYLKALVERNLLLVTDKKSNGKPKSVGMHDLLRDLCMRIADEEKFIHVKNWRVREVTLHSSLRRVSAHTSFRIRDMYGSTEFMTLARSFLCNGRMSHAILSPIFLALRLLRVLDVFDMKFQKFPTEILELVHLRYLAFSCDSILPYGISRLWNLQTLIAGLGSGYVPSELWKMHELRHVKLKNVVSTVIERDSWTNFVQNKLQTISNIDLHRLIDSGAFEGIPNIKKLGISCCELPPNEVDLGRFHKLEILKCSGSVRWPKSRSFVDHLRFPSSLRKLNLKKCDISQRLLRTLCTLPSLEVLKIRKCKFLSLEMEAKDHQKWEADEEDVFESLQFLLLEKMRGLVCWTADQTNFPRLRHLFIRDCPHLAEIPNGIGEITTLQLIELKGCCPSAVASAKEMVEVQQSDYDNYTLQLLIS